MEDYSDLIDTHKAEHDQTKWLTGKLIGNNSAKLKNQCKIMYKKENFSNVCMISLNQMNSA